MIYLDNAATTFPKPVSVIEETARCMKEYCGNPGRGSHSMARLASDKIFEARELLCELFGADSPEDVVFTYNTTYSLNIALKSAVKSPCHILISDSEHNSVFRPVEALRRQGRVTYDTFPTITDSITEEIKKRINKNTKILICRHASNVTGSVLPIEKIGKLCRERNIFFIVDGAQSAGKYDIDIRKCNINALCIPSHKGLYGPQGAGAVIFNNVNPTVLNTFIEGGSGSASLEPTMPEGLPDRFEGGTLATPVIAGWCEGIRFVMKNTPGEILRHERELCRIMSYYLLNDSRFTVYGADSIGTLLSFNIKGRSSTEVCEELDRMGICTRGGFHCSPMTHKLYDTGDSGAVRVSFGAFNEQREVASLINALWNIKKLID